MITKTCCKCQVETVILENKLTDFRCNTPKCAGQSVIFSSPVQRQLIHTENWEYIKAGVEVPIGSKQGTLNVSLWTIRVPSWRTKKKEEVKEEESG